jgi:ABC-type multidrug transport system ATPase subunit
MHLSIQNLTKTYANGVTALNDVSLEIGKGMFGLLGPNGAGKSTLMKIVATLLEPTSGSVQFGDIDVLKEPDALRRRLGYLPQEFGVYPRITPPELLHHMAILKGIMNKNERTELINALLERVNLFQHRKKYISSFSGGMKQRIGIAQALLGSPQLLIVDEPTAGLDPGERNRFYNLLADIGDEVAVILSTHIVEDVYELCNNMAIIDKGKLLFSGAPKDAIDQLNGKIWEKAIPKSEIAAYQQQYRVISNRLVAGQPLIHVLSTEHPGDGFALSEADLEDVFFSAITNQG